MRKEKREINMERIEEAVTIGKSLKHARAADKIGKDQMLAQKIKTANL